MKIWSVSLWVVKSSHLFMVHKRMILLITKISLLGTLLSRNTTFSSMVSKEECLNKKSTPHCFTAIMKKKTLIIHFRSSIILKLFLPLLRWESKKGLSFKSSREAVTDKFPTFHPSCVSSFCHKAGPAVVEVSKSFPTQIWSNFI